MDSESSWISPRSVGVFLLSSSFRASVLSIRIWGPTSVSRSPVSISRVVDMPRGHRVGFTRAVSVWTVNGSAIVHWQRRSCLLYTPITNLPLVRTGWRSHLACSSQFLDVDPCLVMDKIVSQAQNDNISVLEEPNRVSIVSPSRSQRIIAQRTRESLGSGSSEGELIRCRW